MRTIKFRGKDVFTDAWRYGDLVHNQKVTTTGLEPHTIVFNTATFEIVWNEVIGGFSLKGKISNLVSTTPLGLMIDTNNTEKK